MSQATLTAAQLTAMTPGSYERHELLQEAVLALLRANRVPALVVHTGPRVSPRAGGGFDLRSNRSQAGMADILACLPPDGRLALLEIKSGRARRSRAQIELHQRFAAAGALCLVVRDLQDVASCFAGGRAHIQGHGGTR